MCGCEGQRQQRLACGITLLHKHSNRTVAKGICELREGLGIFEMEEAEAYFLTLREESEVSAGKGTTGKEGPGLGRGRREWPQNTVGDKQVSHQS